MPETAVFALSGCCAHPEIMIAAKREIGTDRCAIFIFSPPLKGEKNRFIRMMRMA